MVFDIGPEQIDVGMESAVDAADFACDRPGFGIGRDVVPFSRFGTARNYEAIESCPEYIGFRAGFLDEFALVDAGGVDDFRNLFWWTISQPGEFGEHKRTADPGEGFQRPIELDCKWLGGERRWGCG
jgi:hypothetical protein